MKIRNISKKILITAIAVMVIPCSVFASSPQLSTDSTGRFEYDSDGDGSQNIILDSGDVDKLSSAENTNASDISVLQSKYASLITSLDSAKSELDSISASGTADASNIDEGMTAVVKGNLITGTRTLAAETPGTATAANISKDKTAWVNGVKVTGTGEDEANSTLSFSTYMYAHVPNDLDGGNTSQINLSGFSTSGYKTYKIVVTGLSGGLYANGSALGNGTYTFNITSSSVIYGHAGYCANMCANVVITLYK